jgi:hypothetical protein
MATQDLELILSARSLKIGIFEKERIKKGFTIKSDEDS